MSKGLPDNRQCCSEQRLKGGKLGDRPVDDERADDEEEEDDAVSLLLYGNNGSPNSHMRQCRQIAWYSFCAWPYTRVSSVL